MIKLVSTSYASDNKLLKLSTFISGGVGTVAIQYLKSQGAKITTTCTAASFPLLTELGADFCIDYKSDNVEKDVESHGP